MQKGQIQSQFEQASVFQIPTGEWKNNHLVTKDAPAFTPAAAMLRGGEP